MEDFRIDPQKCVNRGRRYLFAFVIVQYTCQICKFQLP